VKLISLTATSDAPVISRDRTGALHPIRQPNPGELYRLNELGDLQTEAPVHGGLTAFGTEAVRRV
jgi:membrane dipeptidase